MWEDVEQGIFRKNRRIRCAIKFEEVLHVKSKNINQKNKNRSLECLAIKSNLNSDNNYEIKPVLETLLKSSHFYEIHTLGAPIKGPIDFSLGVIRQLPFTDHQISYMRKSHSLQL